MSQKYKIGDMLSTREVLGEAISNIAGIDDRVWALTSDCGGNMSSFKQNYPERFVDDGIAEQNAAGMAAGLALSGAVPYIMGMAPFVTMRAFEQDRSAISYQNLPVRIVGYTAGMTTGGGSTHYAMEDIAIMRAVTNMTVISVSDPLLGMEAIKAGLDYKGPYYMRCGNGKSDPILYDPGNINFEIGKGILAREGKDLTIITHGVMVKYAISIADRLAKEGICVEVLDMFTIKPMDTELIRSSVLKTRRVIVWEDHNVYGGLGTAVSEMLVDEKLQVESFIRVGIPSTYPGFGSDVSLYQKYQMDEKSVEQLIYKLL